MDIAQLQKERSKAEDRVKQLEKEIAQAKLESVSPLAQYALQAHDGLCTSNHTDGCGWGYEIHGEEHDWSAPTHVEWLEKIEEVLRNYPLLKLDELDMIVKSAIIFRKYYRPR